MNESLLVFGLYSNVPTRPEYPVVWDVWNTAMSLEVVSSLDTLILLLSFVRLLLVFNLRGVWIIFDFLGALRYR